MIDKKRTIYVEENTWKQFQKKCIDLKPKTSASKRISQLIKKDLEGGFSINE